MKNADEPLWLLTGELYFLGFFIFVV